MLQKRAQITISIIVGIVILFSVGLIFFLKSELTKENIDEISSSSLDIMPISSYVESCIKSTGKDAILWVGRQGGYYELPISSTNEYFIKTAYYFYVDKNVMPSKERVEQELSDYMDKELFFCIKNFADFKEQGYKIEQGEIKTDTLVRQGNVLFQVDFPVMIKKGTSETKLQSFSSSVKDMRLNTIYDVSTDIINEQLKDYSSICLSCLINLSIENDLYIDMNRLGNNTILFTITDFNSMIDYFPYKYTFANKYLDYSCTSIPHDLEGDKLTNFLIKCMEEEFEEEYAFHLEEIPDMNAYVDEVFYYTVNATGLNLTFIDHSFLLNLSQRTGIILFKPTKSQIGEHDVWVSVSDHFGNEKYSNFVLNISEKNE